MAVEKIGPERGAGVKVLLLHPEDDFRHTSGRTWDLVVDLGRAPAATYQRWMQIAECDVCSLHDLAEEIEDLHRARDLMRAGFGRLVDRYGIDWWDVLLPDLLRDVLLLMLVERQARQLSADCELDTSRPSFLASALATRVGVAMRTVGISRWKRGVLHYSNLLTQLDKRQLAQVFEDKFRIHRFAPGFSAIAGPMVLLPSAYVNGSRMAVHLAERMPEHNFLLMYTRSSGKLRSVPANVCMKALRVDSTPANAPEIAELLASWETLKTKLTAEIEAFAFANSVGVFHKVPARLRDGAQT